MRWRCRWNASADARVGVATDPTGGTRVDPVIDGSRWRSRADGPRWLYARPGRLRAGWRLAAFALAMLVFQPIAESFIAPIFGAVSRAVGEPVAAYPWITLVSVFASMTLVLRVVDEAPWSTVGLDLAAWRPRVLMSGVLFGTGAIGVTMILLFVTGVAHVEAVALPAEMGLSSDSWGRAALRLTALLAPSALWEELVFRGFLWTVAADAGGIRVARWSTACAFGAMHLMNPGAGALSMAVVVSAGFCLGALREYTGSLPAAWMAHLAWNWVMAVGLNVPVSGVEFEVPGYQTVIDGPTWWTGGSWGPEGGVAALLVMTGALAWWMRTTSWRSFRTETKSR